MNSTWLITSELANQGVKKALCRLFTCVVYTNDNNSANDIDDDTEQFDWYNVPHNGFVR